MEHSQTVLIFVFFNYTEDLPDGYSVSTFNAMTRTDLTVCSNPIQLHITPESMAFDLHSDCTYVFIRTPLPSTQVKNNQNLCPSTRCKRIIVFCSKTKDPAELAEQLTHFSQWLKDQAISIFYVSKILIPAAKVNQTRNSPNSIKTASLVSTIFQSKANNHNAFYVAVTSIFKDCYQEFGDKKRLHSKISVFPSSENAIVFNVDLKTGESCLLESSAFQKQSTLIKKDGL
ncbi:MAG: hypothetical protein AAGI66_08615 [Cyanobacteria bacterium P01_H01_bin.74]